MKPRQGKFVIPQAVSALIFVALLIALAVLTAATYNRSFTPVSTVTLTSERAGLVMEPYAKVKYRGIQVGHVASIQSDDPVKLRLELNPGDMKFIPANVGAEITAPTAFGAKYVNLVPPTDPSPRRLAAGAVLHSSNVSIEVNTVFRNLVDILNKIEPDKLNAVLSALAEGFRGKGPAIGEAITDFNQVLTEINPRSETIRSDFRAFKGLADAYTPAAQNLVTTLDALSTTSVTIANNAKNLDSLLLNVIGLGNSGVNLLGPVKNNLISGINNLEPTTRLLHKYNPELTCLLVGAQVAIDNGWPYFLGGHDGKGLMVDAGLMFGDDQYRYPENLPVTGQKGGPGGTPSCGSLPDVTKNWPVRYLVTDSGYGTGVDVRPNSGIGIPGFADYFPVTRGRPEVPSIRHTGPPAPGPIPYPGAPPYGAPWYAPDGKPLYPGLPPAPPPGRHKEPGPPPPGSEPFTPVFPGAQPTYAFMPPPPPAPTP
jgi:phospholipid/cholesterol/gamma-HCH transport system substrate-binding protein